ncbi:MAG: glutamate racemase [Erysipelotrichaceae bacterium]|nr:glutamate racemase [Erysipelotrichaceae bacterium]
MNNRPVGVFDSGVGGLSSLRVLENLLPDEQYVFFGDTGRMPYGDKSRDELEKIAQSDIDFLKSFDVKAILIACGTLSSNCLDKLVRENDVPLFGVIDAAVKKAAEQTETGKIGVIATRATVHSGAFRRKLKQIDPKLQVMSRSCPKFAPMVERGHFEKDDPVVRENLRYYLRDFRNIDTLILGCTHYSLLKEAIDDHFDHKVRLIDAAAEGAQALAAYLRENDLLSSERKENEFYCSGDCGFFERKAAMFLGQNVNVRKHVI